MHRPLHLALSLLVAAAVIASGCGSGESASTTTTRASVAQSTATSQATTPSTVPTTRSTGATGQTPTTKVVPQVAKAPPTVKKAIETVRTNSAKRAQARREGELRLKAAREAREAESAPGPGFNRTVSHARKFPPEIYRPFYAQCGASKGSAGVCECILVKLELAKGERDRSIAELVAIEVALKEGASVTKLRSTLLPPNAKVAVKQCVP